MPLRVQLKFSNIDRTSNNDTFYHSQETFQLNLFSIVMFLKKMTNKSTLEHYQKN